MSILRAGPWGDLSDSFQDEPTDQPCSLENGQPTPAGCTVPLIFPVNAANKDWTNHPWKALAISDGLSTSYNFLYASSVVLLGEDADAYGDLCNVEFKFCYQATADFSLTINWDVPGFSQFEQCGVNWFYNILEGGSNSGTYSNLSGNGSQAIDFPMAVFAIASMRVAFGGFDLRTLTASVTA